MRGETRWSVPDSAPQGRVARSAGLFAACLAVSGCFVETDLNLTSVIDRDDVPFLEGEFIAPEGTDVIRVERIGRGSYRVRTSPSEETELAIAGFAASVFGRACEITDDLFCFDSLEDARAKCPGNTDRPECASSVIYIAVQEEKAEGDPSAFETERMAAILLAQERVGDDIIVATLAFGEAVAGFVSFAQVREISQLGPLTYPMLELFGDTSPEVGSILKLVTTRSSATVAATSGCISEDEVARLNDREALKASLFECAGGSITSTNSRSFHRHN